MAVEWSDGENITLFSIRCGMVIVLLLKLTLARGSVVLGLDA